MNPIPAKILFPALALTLFLLYLGWRQWHLKHLKHLAFREKYEQKFTSKYDYHVRKWLGESVLVRTYGTHVHFLLISLNRKGKWKKQRLTTSEAYML